MVPVLVIDDSPTVRAVVRAGCTQAGYQVLEAADGNAGLQTLRELRGKVVVVLNLTMPHPDGRAVLLTLNASPAWRARFAVILCSARNEVAEVARELGADDYLEKPFKIARLLELVQRGYWQLLADSAEAREHRNANSAD